MRLKLISTLLIVSLLLPLAAMAEQTSSSSSGGQPADLRQSILASADNVKSYKVSVDNVVKDTFTNNTGAYLVTVSTKTNSIYDKTAGASEATATNTIEFNGRMVGQGITQSYLIDSMIYNNVNNNWTKYSVPNTSAALSQLNDYIGNAQLIYNSTADVIGTDQIDGQNYYKLKVTPAMGFADFVALNQVLLAFYRTPLPLPATLSPSDIANSTSNSDVLQKNSNITWTVWVSKDSSQIRRIQNSIKISLAPNQLNLPADKTPNFKLDIDNSVTFDYSDFNKPGSIALPSEAQNAMTIIPSAASGSAA